MSYMPPQKSRTQMQFFCLEELIAPDNVVRLIDVFVESLNLTELGFHVLGQSTLGRKAYNPKLFLKLYIYGYLHCIRTSRKLAKACICNFELLWLLEGASPRYRTIATFRALNRVGFEQLFKYLNHFLQGEELFTTTTFAIDSSKFRGQNSRSKNYNLKKVRLRLSRIDKQLKHYLNLLDTCDKSETAALAEVDSASISSSITTVNPAPQKATISDDAITATTATAAVVKDTLNSPKKASVECQALETRIKTLETRAQAYEEIKKQLELAEQVGQQQLSTTDPDARLITVKKGVTLVGYNVQTSVDSVNKLIAHYEVTNTTDAHALFNVASATKTALNKTNVNVLADKGYDTAKEFEQCAAHQITTYVAPKKKASKKDAGFDKTAFIYNKTADTYSCPAGEVLTTNHKEYARKQATHQVKVYKISFKKCKQCPYLNDCISAKKIQSSQGRTIERDKCEVYWEDNKARVEANPALYKQRKAIVEHPYGTIKRQWGYGYTLLKGKQKVSGEFALIFLAYNLRRSMSIFGVLDLIKRLKNALFTFLGIIVYCYYYIHISGDSTRGCLLNYRNAHY